MSLINRKEYRKSDLRSVFRWMPSPLLRIMIILTMPIGLIGVLLSGWSVREHFKDYIDYIFARYV